MNVVTEVRLARIALDGGRFDEAERRFQSIAQRTNHASAWFALGAAKAAKLALGAATVAEVCRCFDLARDLADSDDDRRELEATAATVSLQTIRHMFERLGIVARGGLESANALKSNAMMTGLAVLSGTSSKTLFGAAASYNVFDRSLNAIGSARDDLVTARTVAEQIMQDISALAQFIRQFSPAPTDEYRLIVSELDSLPGPAGHHQVPAANGNGLAGAGWGAAACGVVLYGMIALWVLGAIIVVLAG